MVEWEQGGEDLDREFQEDNCVPLEIDSEDDVPPSDSDGDVPFMDDNQEFGVIDEKELYSDDDLEGGVDNALCRASHKESVLSVAVSPIDQRMLVTGGQDDVAIIWNLEEAGSGVQCKERCRLTGHTDSIVQVAFSNDGKYIATGGYDGLVKIWAGDTGALVHSLEGPSKEVEWILWHPKGHAILAGSNDTMAWMWWAPTGKLMQIFAGHAQSVTSGCWGLGGKVICTGSEDKSVIVWNPRQGTPQQHLKQVHESAILSMCSHPEAPIIVSGSEDATARVIQIETGKVVAHLTGHMDSVEAVGFNNAAPADGLLLLATASMDGKIMIWDGKTFELRCTLKEHIEKGGVVKLKWLPQRPHLSSFFCTCATDATVRLFNGLTGQCLGTMRGHTATVLDLDLFIANTGDKVCVATGSEDKTCRFFTIPLDGSAAIATAAPVATAAAPVAQAAPAATAAAAAGYPGSTSNLPVSP
jgi:ribosome assembly protein SQT1